MENNFTPKYILLFTLGVFLLLGGFMLVTPEEGVEMGVFTFHMPAFGEMLFEEDEDNVDISEIVDSQFDIDTVLVEQNVLAVTDSVREIILRASYDSLVQKIHRIEYRDTGRLNLVRFFRKLHENKPTRIMHYGDSQLEGDRISSFLRNKFQVKFGGSGPGLLPAVQPYDYVFTAIQEHSENWTRYPVYGKVDSAVTHNRYGVMGAFSRYAPLLNDSVPADSVFCEADLSISKSNISYRRTQHYKRMRMFYGNAAHPVNFLLFVGDSLFYTDSLKSGVDYDVISCDLPDSTDRIRLKFDGWSGPDIYGIELAESGGVIVDNIALRGSSGTIFTKSDFAHSARMFRDLNPGLFILQFGGNVMPYIKNQRAIDNYGRWFKSQIIRLQAINPDAAFIVVGPSDMSTKEKDKFVTYPHLPAVVEMLKKVALESGCGYWDMYEAMGGHNSMPEWVNAEPELARPDYVHFSARGARLIANMFYNALIFEYNSFLLEHINSQPAEDKQDTLKSIKTEVDSIRIEPAAKQE